MGIGMSVQTPEPLGTKDRDTGRLRRGPGSHRKNAWLIVGLLFLFMLINFADKAVIGIAAVPIMQELQLSPREFGLIGSSFFLLF